jgi:MFS family permease
LFHSTIYYLSIWYTRKELASRIGVFYAALTASSAFGGLLAYGMFQIEGGSYFPWSYLFFLEGGLTILCGIILAVVLPSGPQSAWFLKPREKDVAILRLEQDSVSTVDTKFNWKEAFGEFYTPHGYLRCALSFCGGTLLTSNANFLAMVVARLGYDVVKTNLVSHSIHPRLALWASRGNQL